MNSLARPTSQVQTPAAVKTTKTATPNDRHAPPDDLPDSPEESDDFPQVPSHLASAMDVLADLGYDRDRARGIQAYLALFGTAECCPLIQIEHRHQIEAKLPRSAEWDDPRWDSPRWREIIRLTEA